MVYVFQSRALNTTSPKDAYWKKSFPFLEEKKKKIFKCTLFFFYVRKFFSAMELTLSQITLPIHHNTALYPLCLLKKACFIKMRLNTGNYT